MVKLWDQKILSSPVYSCNKFKVYPVIMLIEKSGLNAILHMGPGRLFQKKRLLLARRHEHRVLGIHRGVVVVVDTLYVLFIMRRFLLVMVPLHENSCTLVLRVYQVGGPHH